MKDINTIKQKKVIAAVALTCVFVLSVCSSLFIIFIFIPYSGYMTRIKSDYMNTPEARNTEYRYSVKMFSYLKVSNPGEILYSSNGTVTVKERPSYLTIYTNAFGKNEYHVQLLYSEYEFTGKKTIQSGNIISSNEIGIGAIVDDNGNIIDKSADLTENKKKLINENKDEINTLISLGKKCWGLNGLNDILKSFTYENKGLLAVGLTVLVLLIILCILSVKCYLWLIKRKLPFLLYCKDMKKAPGKDKCDYVTELGGKTYSATAPRLFKNDGVFSVFENCEDEKTELTHIQLVIYTDFCGEPKYYVLAENVNISVFRAKKTKFEFYSGKIISDNDFVKNNSDKIVMLINDAKMFWKIQ